MCDGRDNQVIPSPPPLPDTGFEVSWLFMLEAERIVFFWGKTAQILLAFTENFL